DYPIGPGGNGNGGGRGVDAGLGDTGADADGDAGVQITGRVCVIIDLRTPTVCSTADASPLTVSIGTTRTARPNARGDFTINAPLGPFLWRVTGTNFNTSIVPVSADNTLPVMSDTLYLELLATNQVTRPAELVSSAVVRVVHGGTMAVTSVVATSNPATTDLPFYDDDDSLDWRSDLLGTGPNGVVWLPDLPLAAATGSATVTLKPPQGSSVSTVVTLEDQAITFVTVEL
ncbi:MAG: hypothetical protein ACRDMZ_16685, partial [Solirubrobacteraceae bacterium]